MMEQPRPKSRRANKAPEDRGLSTALNFIKFRPRSSLEVVRRLQRAQLSANEINSIMVQLSEIDIINDSRFARDWARSRDRLHPIGDFLLKRELSEKGITDEVIERVMDERENADWFEEIGLPFDGRRLELVLATDLVQRRSSRWQRLEGLKRKQSIMQFLSRRGFGPDTITKLVFGSEEGLVN